MDILAILKCEWEIGEGHSVGVQGIVAIVL